MLNSKEAVDAFRLEGCNQAEFEDYQARVLAFLRSA
jgi:hypothetical protein